MICPDARELVHAYADDELDVATSGLMQAHLRDCADCRKAFELARAVKIAISRAALSEPAPRDLPDQITHFLATQSSALDVHDSPRASRNGSLWVGALRSAPKPARLSGRQRAWPLALAAALLLSAGIFWLIQDRAATARFASIDPREVLDAHLRSLAPDLPSHRLDVVSTDQHTVKPWFDLHLDFSPPVRDLSGDGFPLVGGRLDYIHEHPVATIVYQRGAHQISLFVWPGTSPDQAVVEQRGYHLIPWSAGGMTFWAVSDLRLEDLEHFRDLLRAAGAPSVQ